MAQQSELGNLVLTGPGRAISADGPVGFRIYLHDYSQDISVEETWKKSMLLYRENPTLDRSLLDTANTPYGPVEVIYAVLSQGVECEVAVRLTHRDVKDPISLFGRIVARNELFDIGCVLFYNEDVKGICA
ncbi:60 kDa jasmonate-induced protein-like [Triticum urartu]|uniref:60 kDa jasmonate-induced protein-like n=1 Tax=Triticum urartu TaxID=4572 RepID=UPI002044B25F|nr:60 kDa jasmonate-induced protein-like [Triticum urartu]XP_048546117.1 60 kDa jasmonate-induced protein-like [Triticum urartu]